ncbi:MAG TPA: hypothetical protein VFX98_06105 [Longimicrobiaceae bacterium]|nr:hypothetical protein [Longimicrobiaceae bacterium]
MGRKNPRPNENDVPLGSHVTFRLGKEVYTAEVVEDRGYIGWNGRRLIRVVTFNEYEEARQTLELPAEDLTVIAR